MKTIVLLMALAMSTNVMAFGDVESKSSSGATAKAGAMAGASSRSSSHQAQGQGQGQGQLQGQAMRGNDVTVQDSSRYEATDGRDWAPSVGAPGLTTGICMGSISAGGSGAGFGLSFGSTVADKECQVRYNSIRLAQVGQDAAATVILCQVVSMRIALKQTGYECPTVKHDDEVGVAGEPNEFPSTTYQSQSIIGGGMYSH